MINFHYAFFLDFFFFFCGKTLKRLEHRREQKFHPKVFPQLKAPKHCLIIRRRL